MGNGFKTRSFKIRSFKTRSFKTCIGRWDWINPSRDIPNRATSLEMGGICTQLIIVVAPSSLPENPITRIVFPTETHPLGAFGERRRTRLPPPVSHQADQN
jgi:hypothetical protein